MADENGQVETSTTAPNATVVTDQGSNGNSVDWVAGLQHEDIHDGATPGDNRTLMEQELGVANGIATLDEGGLVPKSQLGNVPVPDKSDYGSITAVETAEIKVDVQYLRTAGYYAPGDGGDALYKRVISEPAHAGKVQSADGAWWEISGQDFNVRMFGAKGDAVNDDHASIMAAVNFVDAKGGGIIRLPHGQYRISSTLILGDGSNTQVSTKHHRISLIGVGVGSHNGLDFIQVEGATEIIYDGIASSGAAVLYLCGPLHSMAVKNIVLNGGSKAGEGIQINHVTDSLFESVVTKKIAAIGWHYITRNGFPSACAYGTGNNMANHCYNVEPSNTDVTGIVMTSGVSEAASLTGQPDTANCDIIGGAYFYGG